MDNKDGISMVSLKTFGVNENDNRAYMVNELGKNAHSKPQEKPEDEVKSDPVAVRDRNFRIWKSVLSMGFSFMLLYTSYTGLFTLQSSLHVQEGMGTICASVRYICNVVSALFLPKLMITYIGHKWTITFSMLGFIVWMAANGYGIWATMIPASIINGLFVAPLWAAQGAYYTRMGKEYAQLNDQAIDSTVTLFFGIFYMFYLASGIFGNIISTTVLKSSPSENVTEPDEDVISEQCGIHDCPWNSLNNTNLEPVPDKTVWILCGIYIAVAVVAIMISALFVDQLPNRVKLDSKQKKQVFSEIKSAFVDTMTLVKDKKLLLLIPLTFYVGLEETFFFGDFNRSWVTCALGIWMVGLINIPFAISGTCGSVVLGKLSQFIGRIPILVLALGIDVTLQLSLVLWSIDPDKIYPFYLISTFWGISDAIWITLTTAMYGIVFPKQSDAAFSQYMLWQCAGYALAFGYSYFLCSNVKLIILHASLWCGIICFFVLEKIHSRSTANTFDLIEKEVTV